MPDLSAANIHSIELDTGSAASFSGRDSPLNLAAAFALYVVTKLTAEASIEVVEVGVHDAGTAHGNEDALLCASR
jgi:hypothetical protein